MREPTFAMALLCFMPSCLRWRVTPPVARLCIIAGILSVRLETQWRRFDGCKYILSEQVNPLLPSSVRRPFWSLQLDMIVNTEQSGHKSGCSAQSFNLFQCHRGREKERMLGWWWWQQSEQSTETKYARQLAFIEAHQRFEALQIEETTQTDRDRQRVGDAHGAPCAALLFLGNERKWNERCSEWKSREQIKQLHVTLAATIDQCDASRAAVAAAAAPAESCRRTRTKTGQRRSSLLRLATATAPSYSIEYSSLSWGRWWKASIGVAAGRERERERRHQDESHESRRWAVIIRWRQSNRSWVMFTNNNCRRWCCCCRRTTDHSEHHTGCPTNPAMSLFLSLSFADTNILQGRQHSGHQYYRCR